MGYDVKNGVLVKYTPVPGEVIAAIPAGVKEIGRYAFQNASNIMEVVMPEGLTTVGFNAFKDCTMLKKVRLPKSITFVNSDVFNGCKALDDVTFSNAACFTYGSEEIFQNCSSLKAFYVPDGVRVLSANTFKNCTSLTSVNIPVSLMCLEEGCFSGCSSLRDLVIRDGDASYDFKIDKSFDTLQLRRLRKSIKPYMGDFCINNGHLIECVTAPGQTSVKVPDNVTDIGEDAFSGLDKVEEIILPAGLKTVDRGAFKDCSALKEIRFPKGFSKVWATCFQRCRTIKSVSLGDDQTKLFTRMFRLCTALTTVEIPYKVSEVGSQVFQGCSMFSELIIRTPQGARYSFKTDSDLDQAKLQEFKKMIDNGQVKPLGGQTVTFDSWDKVEKKPVIIPAADAGTEKKLKTIEDRLGSHDAQLMDMLNRYRSLEKELIQLRTRVERTEKLLPLIARDIVSFYPLDKEELKKLSLGI